MDDVPSGGQTREGPGAPAVPAQPSKVQKPAGNANSSAGNPDLDLILRATDPAPLGGPSPLTTSLDALPVTGWDRYELIELLGAGGMGAVYRARDSQLGRIVAIKFIRGDNPDLLQRFLQEAHALARLDHPSLCRIYEAGMVEGKPYIVMQFVDGVPLDKMREQLTLHQKVQLIRDAAFALHEVHRLGIVHRDVKPSNILVERLPDGGLRPIVMDFGLARDSTASNNLTATGAVLGTPAFMSPEQARGNSRRLDRRADVYSLGATLYELLTGLPPFVAAELVDVILAVLNDPPKSPRARVPQLPVALETITLKCLEKEPEGRYDSARALAEDLQRHIDGVDIQGRPVGLMRRVRRFAGRNKALFTLAVLAALSLVTLLALGARMEIRSRRQAQLAHDLGQDIKEMEMFVRAAYFLPLHDIARERTVVRKRMDDMTVKLRTADAASAVAVRYALGRGHLVLREYSAAQTMLQQAWAGGYRTAEAKMALGRTLGERYREELERAQRTGNKQWFETRKRDLVQQYLQPAVRYLSDAEGAIETPTYVRGLLAFYRDDEDLALRLARQAQAESPWLSEPLKLEADVLQARGVRLADRGEHARARELLLQAAARHQAAAAIGRSDSRIYAAEALDWIRIMEADDVRGASIAEGQKGALTATGNAIASDPRAPLGYQLAAWMSWRIGFSKLNRGLDATQDVQQAVDLARQAVDLDRNDWHSHYFYALALGGLSEVQDSQGKGTATLSEQAIAALQRSIELNKNFSWSWNDLGLRHLSIFRIQRLHGIYDKERFEQARDAFQAAVRVEPTYIHPITNTLALFNEDLRYRITHGQPIDAHVALARQAAQKLSAAGSQDLIASLNAIGIELRVLQHATLAGQDPRSLRPQIDQLQGALERWSALNPESDIIDLTLAEYYHVKGQNELRAGGNPRASVDAGLRALDTGERKGSTKYDLAYWRALLYLLASQSAAGDAAAMQAQALQAADRALLQSPQPAEPHDLLCQVLHRSVLPRGGTTPQTAAQATEETRRIERGVQECDAALRIDPTLATSHAGRAVLLLRKAVTQGPRDALITQARQSLDLALQINPGLRSEYAALLGEIARLSTEAPQRSMPPTPKPATLREPH